MGQLSMMGTAWDAWRTTRAGQEGIAARQRARLSELLGQARAHSPFYRELYKDLPDRVEDIRQLPVVTKRQLMANFDDWVTDPQVKYDELRAFIDDKSRVGELYRGKYLACTTSGTTGTPAVLLQDQRVLAVVGALNLARTVPAWLSPGSLLKMLGRGAKTAAVWATGGHYLGLAMLKRQLIERPSRASRMRVFPVLSPLAQIVAELNAYQPAMLNGYATAISLLAQEQEAGRLKIKPVLVLTSSESLPPVERERIAAAFGAIVRDNYGSSEFVAIGYDCGHGWLHVHADWVILEPVDENYQPVQPGQTSSSVLLTNLANHVQPIIRYELGDRITVRPDRCPCGSPLPAIRVEGRTDDILRFASPTGETIPVLPLALWATVKETPGINRFQLIQTSPSRLDVRLEAAAPEERQAVWLSVRERLLAFLGTQGVADVSVELLPEPPLRDPRSGKYRHVWSEVGSANPAPSAAG
ncbi:MAG: phenylacetate--CoA ligase family protein [Chloroflexota bacterium]